MIPSQEIKEKARILGADLCGIASVDRFCAAPEGFHPRDVLPCGQSVIVIAREFLRSTIQSKSKIPYTIVRNLLSNELDRLSVELCVWLERKGHASLPTGTIGPTAYDERTGRSRNIISAKHSAELAGLGRIARNTLLVTPEYGNVVWLCAIITEAKIEPDPLITSDPCPDGCMLCVKNCPAQALGQPEMDQQRCWQHSFSQEGHQGDWHIRCYRCREICPRRFGTLNGGKAW